MKRHKMALSDYTFTFTNHKTINMKKKILYIDMDGVIADFDEGIALICKNPKTLPDFKTWDSKVDYICANYSDFFHNIPPIIGAIDAVKYLMQQYEVYFLSTPMWDVPNSYIGKRIWIEKHFPLEGKKRLILTHRKDLQIGAYLIDDRLRNGVENFTGKHIHFGTEEFANWEAVLTFLEIE
jgi:5'(3')-deoxyribonucleotidase